MGSIIGMQFRNSDKPDGGINEEAKVFVDALYEEVLDALPDEAEVDLVLICEGDFVVDYSVINVNGPDDDEPLNAFEWNRELVQRIFDAGIEGIAGHENRKWVWMHKHHDLMPFPGGRDIALYEGLAGLDYATGTIDEDGNVNAKMGFGGLITRNTRGRITTPQIENGGIPEPAFPDIAKMVKDQLFKCTEVRFGPDSRTIKMMRRMEELAIDLLEAQKRNDITTVTRIMTELVTMATIEGPEATRLDEEERQQRKAGRVEGRVDMDIASLFELPDAGFDIRFLN